MSNTMKRVQQRKRRWCKGSLCGLLLFGVIFISCGKKQELSFAVSGSGGIISALKNAADVYEKGRRIKITVIEAPSIAGLNSLLEGKCDLAASLMRMPGEMSLRAKKQNKKISGVTIGYDVIVPIVHKSNPLDNLFLGQLADMYAGLIDDWKDVEMKPGRIVVVDREKSSAIRSVMTERFFYSEDKEVKSIIESSDEAVAAAVAREPNAIGYISRTAIVDGVKIITINTIAPTDDNVLKKYYKLYRELYLYYDETNPRGAIREFVDYLLGTEGQKVLHKAGIIPASLIK